MQAIGEGGEQILLPLILSLIAIWAARSIGFFVLPKDIAKGEIPYIRFWQVLSVFLIYIGCSLLIPVIAAQILSYYFPQLSQSEISDAAPLSLRLAYIQMITLGVSGLCLFLFCLLQRDRTSMRHLWKYPRHPFVSISRDFGIGALTWLISFPLVTLVGSVADWFINVVFGNQEYIQVAVHYLKSSRESYFHLFFALFTIVLAAPIVEEFLFRGFLQNFLKRHLGRKSALLLTALLFALFHFSLSQNLGNIPLVSSLFVLALFLGYLYERQQSLFASIGLHMTFNTISVLRILFVPEA